jgi:hypothetical protein
MNHAYAIAYSTEDLDGNRDLYVDALIAESDEHAVGKSMLNWIGAEIQSRGEKIIGVNVKQLDDDDIEDMVDENRAALVVAE